MLAGGFLENSPQQMRSLWSGSKAVSSRQIDSVGEVVCVRERLIAQIVLLARLIEQGLSDDPAKVLLGPMERRARPRDFSILFNFRVC